MMSLQPRMLSQASQQAAPTARNGTTVAAPVMIRSRVSCATGCTFVGLDGAVVGSATVAASVMAGHPWLGNQGRCDGECSSAPGVACARMSDLTPRLLWQPSRQRRERATLSRYMRWLRAERGGDAEDYDALWRWSVEEVDAFWASIWDFFYVQSAAPYDRVLGRREMPGAEWFPGTRLNHAEH